MLIKFNCILSIGLGEILINLQFMPDGTTDLS